MYRAQQQQSPASRSFVNMACVTVACCHAIDSHPVQVRGIVGSRGSIASRGLLRAIRRLHVSTLGSFAIFPCGSEEENTGQLATTRTSVPHASSMHIGSAYTVPDAPSTPTVASDTDKRAYKRVPLCASMHLCATSLLSARAECIAPHMALRVSSRTRG